MYYKGVGPSELPASTLGTTHMLHVKNNGVFVRFVENVLRTHGVARRVRDASVYSKVFDATPTPAPTPGSEYERMEFLGDAVLGAIVAKYLYERYPEQQEGFLTEMRAKLVNGEKLSELCVRVGLDRFIPNKNAKNALEDTFEAFVSAIMLDLGYEACENWVTAVIESNCDFSDIVRRDVNVKDRLFKHMQSVMKQKPSFKQLSPCGGTFRCEVTAPDGRVLGKGSGKTKRDSENDAATRILSDMGYRVHGATPSVHGRHCGM